jgi:hypothetical protein
MWEASRDKYAILFNKERYLNTDIAAPVKPPTSEKEITTGIATASRLCSSTADSTTSATLSVKDALPQQLNIVDNDREPNTVGGVTILHKVKNPNVQTIPHIHPYGNRATVTRRSIGANRTNATGWP